MQTNIHPQWFDDAQFVCVCGNTFTIGSTKQAIRVEICSTCHPFYTGEMRFVDTMGRVDKFQQKQKIAQAQKAQLDVKRKKKLEKQEQIRSPKSLREMLLGS